MENLLVNQKEDTTLKGKRSHSVDAVDIRINEQLDTRLICTFAPSKRDEYEEVPIRH